MDEGEELVWGASAMEAVHKSCTSSNQHVVLSMESGEEQSGSVTIRGIKNSQMADKVRSVLKSGGIHGRRNCHGPRIPEQW